MNSKGKTIVSIGAGSGIGRSVAVAASRPGAGVALEPALLTFVARLVGYVLFVLFAVIVAGSAFAQSEWSVDMANARTRIVPQDELPIYCRSNGPIEGCTEFLGEILHCDCHRADGGWSIVARAQLAPTMYLARPAIEQHETLHLDDLREQIARFLGELTARRFDNADSCHSVAEFEMTVFNLRMDLFRELSNRRLH